MKLRSTGAAAALAIAGLLAGSPSAVATPISVGHSGWEWGNPLPQGNALRAVDFLGPIGYAAGDYGTVLESDDGGVTWRGLVSGTTDDLDDVQIIDTASIVVAGDCSVLRSDNGGATFRPLPWTDVGSRCRSPVARISFPTTETGYVLREDGRLYRTDDGGEKWQEVADLTFGSSDGSAGTATDIAFRDASTGIAATDQGIYRTADGGLTWPLVANAPLTGLDGIDLAGSSNAYAVGKGTVLTSSDDGRTWSVRALPNAFRSTRLTSVRCDDAKLCLITTDPGDRILRTVNGGASFVSLPAPVPGTLAVGFTSEGRVVATGLSGESAVSADAGATWSRTDGGVDDSFTQLRGDSGSLAFAIGQQGTLARTLDGGNSWHTVRSPTTADIIDVSFVDAQTGFLLDQDGVLYRTDDGCVSWRAVFQDTEHAPQAVLALDLDQVMLIGARGVRTSVDGGETFNAAGRRAVAHASLFGIDRAGPSVFTYGPTSLFGSRDEGGTWHRIRRPDHRPLAVVDFANAKVGYALGKGGRLWRTRNRGKSWKEMLAAGTDGGIALAAVDAREAYVASNDLFFSSGANRPDYLLHTTDGGRSWRPQLVNDSKNVSGLLATQPSTGLLLAGGNRLFTTSSGGERGARSTVTSRASRRRLVHPGRVRVTGRLRPAKGGERVIVARANADPAQRRGSIDWDFKSARVRSNGTFATIWRARRSSVFVAQWTGDGYRMGAGSRLVRVRVVHHR